METISYFCFSGSLNDFLPLDKKNCSITFRSQKSNSIKDSIESLGVPHTEVGDIFINGEISKIDEKVNSLDQIEVYPKDFTIKEENLIPRFIVDENIAVMAKYLRMLGFDAYYNQSFSDQDIAEFSFNENRTVLTRDIGLLKRKKVLNGYWLRSTGKENQLLEVVKIFGLAKFFKPFTLCLECNKPIHPIDKKEVLDRVPELTYQYFNEFFICPDCNKVFWKGSHYDKMRGLIKSISLDLG